MRDNGRKKSNMTLWYNMMVIYKCIPPAEVTRENKTTRGVWKKGEGK
jgi:hypothetical protein